ncbi:hypothetical protein J5295_05085 [Riemerella anatipestifer]|uniref:hypothetical protein n=1 Tax=Riemerella anatipestifer TaxID=34085 RepID=UPI0007F8855D|nr:hypothetical protein [Riemerella anatipestifer]MBT0526028.1 hypothetical protein [Riemerella anatipestifer]MBT0527895.1 hypothetical protein [Riemerella anatipestifer]MBT0529935.1 hypothetical protein [Riemerella anatipestifer]MBT0531845.1 hypothetical protein [Riemerella anatipestifer]MBT0535590.1 hypothetical protein [Riemerella anatipestifer]
MKEVKSIKYNYHWFVLFIILPSVFLHSYDITLVPFGEHAWAQSDHYALALGFLDNNFDFFHPQTFALNHQFPSKSPIVNPQGITSVDFPLLHFIVALLMKGLGTDAPFVYRITTLIWSWAGLLSLYRAITFIKDYKIALVITSLIALQPIFVYYQDGFHVSIAAFSTFLIGLSFLIYYHKSHSIKLFYLGITFITLATLMRFTHIICLLALALLFFVLIIKYKKWYSQLGFIIVGGILVIAYFGYNIYLQQTYGSVFLNKPVLSDGLADELKNLLILVRNYTLKFLPIFHFSLISVGLFLLKKSKVNISKSKNILFFSIVYGLGLLVFTLVMAWSLKTHNYYALDTWMPWLVLNLVLLFTSIPSKIYQGKRYRNLYLVFIFLSFIYSGYSQYKNYYKSGETDSIIQDFTKAKTFIEDVIDKREPYIILCGYGYNTPLIATKTKAFRIHHYDLDYPIEKEIEFHSPKILVVHDFNFKESNPRMIEQFKKNHILFARTQNISIWKIKK